VLYLGRDLPIALMESVFHNHQWLADTKRSIALKEVQGRLVGAVGVPDDVRLADLTAEGRGGLLRHETGAIGQT
jgi:hypothetical protein